jgi:hypothetical protein
MPKSNSPKPEGKRRSPRKEGAKRRNGSDQSNSKTAAILKMLKRPNGADLAELTRATNWQPHSVRGFLSGHVKKKLGLQLLSDAAANGVRRYRIAS